MGREISISFALNAALGAGFKAAFQSASQSARNVTAAIREMEKSPVGNIGAAMEKQRDKIKGLAGSLKEAKATLATLQSQAQASGGATGMLARQIELAQSRVNNLNGAMQRQLSQYRQTAAQAATTGGSVRRLAQDYDHLSQRIERARRVQAAQAANRAQGDALRSQRADLNSRLTGAAAAAATVAIPAKLSIDFEQSIANVGAVSNASDEDMQKLTETARQLGRDTMYSASQAAEGMKYLAMAGFNTEQTISAMPGLLNLAAASATDLGTTSDIASDILTAFNMKASELGNVGDILTRAFTNSNTDLSMLGETMKYVAPVAASLGMTLDQTAAYAGAMANAGIKASQGGTVLRAAMLRLAAPPKASRNTLAQMTGLEGEELDKLQEELGDGAEALAKLGMTTKDEAGNLRPMVDILEELNLRTANMGNAEKAEVFKNIFGTEASAGMIALADQAAKTVDDKGNAIVDSAGRKTNALRKMLDTTTNKEITAANVAKKQMDTTQGSLRLLSSAWEDAGISVGNLFMPAIRAAAGALSTIANVISGVVNRFPNLSKGIALAVGGVLAFTAASVGIGLVLNIVRTSLNGFRGGLLRLSAAHVAATASTTASTGSLGLFGLAAKAAGAAAKFFAGGLRSILMATGVGALLVGLGFAINLLIDNWDAVVVAMSAAWGWVKDTWGRLGVFFSTLGNNLGAVFSGWGQTITGWVKPAWNVVTSVWNGITTYYSWLFGGIATIASTVWGAIAGLITSPVETVKNIWNGITGFFSGLWDGIVSGVSGKGQLILSIFSWARDGVIGVWNGITGFFSNIANGIAAIFAWAANSISAIWQGLGSFFAGIWNAISASAAALWQNVGAVTSWVFQSVATVWNGAVTFFSGIANGISGAFAWAQAGIVGIWQGVVDFFGFVGQGISASFSGVWQGIVDLAAWAWEGIAAIWIGVSEFFGGIVDSIFGVFTGLFSWLKEKFAWVFSTIDAVSSVVGSITGAVKGAWNAAFGDKKEKGAAQAANGEKASPAASAAANKPLPGKPALSTANSPKIPQSAAQNPPVAPAAQNAAAKIPNPPSMPTQGAAAPAAQNANAANNQVNPGPMVGPGFKPVAAPAAQEAAKKGKSGGGRKKSAGGGGGGRSGAGSSAGGSQNSGPVTVVTLDSSNEIKTKYFPAGARNAAPNATGQPAPSGQQPGGLVASAASALKSSGIGAAIGQGLQGALDIFRPSSGQKDQGAARVAATQTGKPPVLSISPDSLPAATTPATSRPVLPQAPSLVAGKGKGKPQAKQPEQREISIDLTQNFELISDNPAAVRKVMDSLKPDFEALVRKALAKISSDRTRTAYAQ